MSVARTCLAISKCCSPKLIYFGSNIDVIMSRTVRCVGGMLRLLCRCNACGDSDVKLVASRLLC